MGELVSIDIDRDDLHHLIAALELAAEKYRDFAQATVETPPISEQFKAQALICERLRKTIGNAYGY